MTAARPGVDIDRIIAELETLAGKSDAPPPAVTRVLYTEADLAARAYIKDLCLDAGLSIREDPIGNMFRSLGGTATRAGPLSGPARTSTRSRTPAGSTARSECSADWPRSAPCEWPGSSRFGRSSLWSSPARSRPGSASAAWEAGRSPAP